MHKFHISNQKLSENPAIPETRVAKVLQMTNPLTIVGSIVIQTTDRLSDPSVFYPYMDVDENCMNSSHI